MIYATTALATHQIKSSELWLEFYTAATPEEAIGKFTMDIQTSYPGYSIAAIRAKPVPPDQRRGE